jgi:hypothetical protein
VYEPLIKSNQVRPGQKGKVNRELADIRGFACSADRVQLVEAFPGGLRVLLGIDVIVAECGTNPARGYRVDADIIAAKVCRHGLAKRVQATLAGAIGDVIGPG